MIHINELEKLSGIAAEYRDVDRASKLAIGATEDSCEAIIILQDRGESGAITVRLTGDDATRAIVMCRDHLHDKMKQLQVEASEAGLNLGGLRAVN